MIFGREDVFSHIGAESLFILRRRDIFPDMGGVGFVNSRASRRMGTAGGQDHRINMYGSHKYLLTTGQNRFRFHKFLHNGNCFLGRHGEEPVIPGGVGRDLPAATAFGGMDNGYIGNDGQNDDILVTGIGIAHCFEIPADLHQIGMHETKDRNERQIMDPSLESQKQGRSDRLQELELAPLAFPAEIGGQAEFIENDLGKLDRLDASGADEEIRHVSPR